MEGGSTLQYSSGGILECLLWCNDATFHYHWKWWHNASVPPTPFLSHQPGKCWRRTELSSGRPSLATYHTHTYTLSEISHPSRAAEWLPVLDNLLPPPALRQLCLSTKWVVEDRGHFQLPCLMVTQKWCHCFINAPPPILHPQKLLGVASTWQPHNELHSKLQPSNIQPLKVSRCPVTSIPGLQ